MLKEIKKQLFIIYINPAGCPPSKTHNIWLTAGVRIRAIMRAMFKRKLLTGVYNLEGKRMNFRNIKNRGQCSRDIETRDHIIAKCLSETPTYKN